ncbi:MAG: MFS transporter [Candidatus Cybelea sp.]|jgi:MFS family permease
MQPKTPNPFRLALFWLGIQAVWGALLGISLQSRTIELAPADALIAYGRLATAGAIVAAIVQVVVGFYSDARRRGGSRRVEFYVAGALGGAVAIEFFFGARTLAALTIAYIAVQAALNLAIGPYQAIIPDFVDRERTGIASSWMAAFQGAGNAIGALAASFITSARTLGTSLSALLLATCLLTSAHVRRLTFCLPPAGTEKRPPVTRAFVDLFISRALLYIGFYTLLGYLLFYVNGVLGPATLAAGRRETGILIVSFTLVGALGAALAARPSDRMDKRLVATAGAAGFIAALALFIGSHAIVGVALATVLAGLGWGIFLVADWAIACRLLPKDAMAAAMGIWNLAIVLPQIIAPALTTAVLQGLRLGGGDQAPQVAFGLALCETFVGAAWLWRLPRCVIEQ